MMPSQSMHASQSMHMPSPSDTIQRYIDLWEDTSAPKHPSMPESALGPRPPQLPPKRSRRPVLDPCPPRRSASLSVNKAPEMAEKKRFNSDGEEQHYLIMGLANSKTHALHSNMSLSHKPSNAAQPADSARPRKTPIAAVEEKDERADDDIDSPIPDYAAMARESQFGLSGDEADEDGWFGCVGESDELTPADAESANWPDCDDDTGRRTAAGGTDGVIAAQGEEVAEEGRLVGIGRSDRGRDEGQRGSPRTAKRGSPGERRVESREYRRKASLAG